MRIGIIAKDKVGVTHIVRDLVSWLKDRGCEPILEENIARKIGVEGVEIERLSEVVDIALVLGGDGTLLYGARFVHKSGIPICGVNLGSLGFLTEIRIEELYDALNVILQSSLPVEERLMLKAVLLRGEKKERIAEMEVLNDVVINKGALARMLEIDILIDNKYVNTLRADGLIISTPTGSTAYSLAAGGPIVHPSIDTILLTPICPHSLTNRPLLIPGESIVESILVETNSDVYLTLDGQVGFNLEQGDTIVVRRGDTKVRMLHPLDTTYYEILRKKLRWGTRP